MQCISRRESTLQQVVEAIVEKQRDFFLEPQGQLVPLRLVDIAEQLNIHESTVSRAVKERAVRVRRLQSDWESRNGRSPTVSELAQAAGLTVEEVAACEQADVSVDSFERELSGGGRVGDLVGDEGMEERTCLHLSLHEALQDLPDRDRQVLSLRYSRDLTQQQVSRIVGVSQVQVSRIEKRAIEKLREMLRE